MNKLTRAFICIVGRLANDGRKKLYDQNISLVFFVRALVAYVLFVGRSCSSYFHFLHPVRLVIRYRATLLVVDTQAYIETVLSRYMFL
jgi:hypothetical protein